MTITTKPTSPVSQVQLNIGDVEEELISSTVIQYILDNNNNSVPLASTESLKYIISSLAKKVDEEVGDVQIRWSQLLSNYKALLKDLLTNPAYQSNGAGILFGGVSKTEMDRVNNNSDSVNGGVKLGEFSSTSSDSSRSTSSLYHIR